MSSALSEMSLRDAIYGLRATRIYHDKPIPDAVMDELLEASTMACSSTS